MTVHIEDGTVYRVHIEDATHRRRYTECDFQVTSRPCVCVCEHFKKTGKKNLKKKTKSDRS